MIELIRHIAPFDAEQMLSMLEEIFGEEEALLETPQLTGGETAENLDIIYEARENGILVGTIHGTIPKISPTICGLSAMCTAPSQRGKGLGRKLFSAILADVDSLGVEATFLGTGNPVAAKLYHSCGFSYMVGSGVMERYRHGSNAEFRQRYVKKPESFRIVSGSAALRIPMIPLIVCGGRQRVLDINTGLYNCSMVSQMSCMSLYPRYEALVKDGGQFWGVVSDEGVLGAILSAVPTQEGVRADFFCGEGFEHTIPMLIETCTEFCGSFYLQVADLDIRKRPLAEGLGFLAGETTMEKCGNFHLPFTKFYHK